MNMRLFERRGMERRLAERRRYDRRMVIVPLAALDIERRRWPDRRDDEFERREPVERRDH
jgi:hypothetical protein